jgi:hypothetical protein
MVKKVLVLGSGSNLARAISPTFWSNWKCDFARLSKPLDAKFKQQKFDVLLYFGYHKNHFQEIEVVDTIIHNLHFEQFIYVSSLVTELPKNFKRYKYVSNKSNMEEYLEKKLGRKLKIIRLPSVVPDGNLRPSVFATRTGLERVVRDAVTVEDVKVFRSSIQIGKIDFSNSYYRKILNSKIGIMLRPIDLLLRFSGIVSYGYSFAVNDLVLNRVKEGLLEIET